MREAGWPWRFLPARKSWDLLCSTGQSSNSLVSFFALQHLGTAWLYRYPATVFWIGVVFSVPPRKGAVVVLRKYMWTLDVRQANLSSVQFSSVAQSCRTLWDTMNRSRPGLPVHHQLLEFTQTHVHWVGDAISPSHPLSPPSPFTFNLSQCQGLLEWISSSS